MLPAPRPFQDATAAISRPQAATEISAPGPQFELFNRVSFCRFSGALDRSHFFYRNQPVNPRFTPRYQECLDFALRPLPALRLEPSRATCLLCSLYRSWSHFISALP